MCLLNFDTSHPIEIAVYCSNSLRHWLSSSILWGSDIGICLGEENFLLWILPIVLILIQYHVLEDSSASVLSEGKHLIWWNL